MQKLKHLIILLLFTAKGFSQSYNYTYTAGKVKFAVIINENISPKSGEKKWLVTVFDVYDRMKTQTEKTDDPLEIDPFLASVIIKIDKAKMNSVLFKDASRETILQDLLNKFIKGRKEEQSKEDAKVKREDDDKKKKEEADKKKNEEEKKNNPTKPADSKSLNAVTTDTFTRRLTIDSSYVIYLAKKADNLGLTICNETGDKERPEPCYRQAIDDAISATDFKNIFKILLLKHYAKPMTFDEGIDNKIANIYSDWKADNVKKETSEKEKKKAEEKTEFEKAYEQFKTDLGKEETTFTNVGTISLKDSMVNVYNVKDTLIGKMKIDSVKFSIEMGKLSNKMVRVFIKNDQFENNKAPISVFKIKKKQYNKLWNFDDTAYIKLGDVLRYSPAGWYIPEDVDDLLLTPEKKSQTLGAASNLNSLINFSLYTDLAGLLGRRANGLINTDITSRFITNTGNFSNKDITPFSFIEGSVVLSKFDSKFKSMDSTTIKAGPLNQDTVDRMQLMQTAWFKGAMKINFLSARILHSHYLQANGGVRVNIVNADSFYRKERNRDIIMFDYFLEAAYNIHRLKNFGMDISVKWIFQRLADKEQFSNKEWQYIFNPQFSFLYYPNSNQNNKIYLRFNYFANRKKDANNFYQLQFGIKTGLKIPSSK